MNVDFKKMYDLVPVVVQSSINLEVLMLGYMNEEAFIATKKTRKVTFFSRSKQRLWTKGESSGNFLWVKEIKVDCDQDSILIKAFPEGPTCHTGQNNCFNTSSSQGFLYNLENTIEKRLNGKDENSYSLQLANKGKHKVAQKVGEEAVELVIESMLNSSIDFKNEAADLMYHFILLLKVKAFCLQDIEEVLRNRSECSSSNLE